MIGLNFRFFVTLALLVVLITSIIFVLYVMYTLASTIKFEPVPEVGKTITKQGTEAQKYWADKKFSFITVLTLNTLGVLLGGLLMWKN